MDGDDPDTAWIREQVDQVFDPSSESRSADTEVTDQGIADKVALAAALVMSLVFLCFLVVLALTAGP
ncbi:hypothetical protein [Pseudonocardia asaccharolytica]|uniref:Uncharacterized protein n=1 Tax=Pseudonocardia asaccharolytica DSM 44247 = NBRC 16224 TaxID=1123024 RepID=A0A511D061_9PSEU|nr:hypothetical protein [Pseudonocardia asaccharolytica]GEL18182.1 hypothetical protein PA7_20190 [Pseudonocardia asaccharolytica DSM 44247 = NBRC 16224]